MASRAQRLNQLSSMYANKKRSGWSDSDIKSYFSRTQKGRLKNDITWGQIASNRKRQTDRRSDFNEAMQDDPTAGAFGTNQGTFSIETPAGPKPITSKEYDMFTTKDSGTSNRLHNIQINNYLHGQPEAKITTQRYILQNERGAYLKAGEGFSKKVDAAIQDRQADYLQDLNDYMIGTTRVKAAHDLGQIESKTEANMLFTPDEKSLGPRADFVETSAERLSRNIMSADSFLKHKVTYPISDALASIGITQKKTSKVMSHVMEFGYQAGRASPISGQAHRLGEFLNTGKFEFKIPGIHLDPDSPDDWKLGKSTKVSLDFSGKVPHFGGPTYTKKDRLTFYDSFVGGAIEGLREKPLKTSVTTALFIGAPYVFGAIGKVGGAIKTAGTTAKSAAVTKAAGQVSAASPKAWNIASKVIDSKLFQAVSGKVKGVGEMSTKFTNKIFAGSIKYGVPAVYFGSVAVRTGMQPTLAGKGRMLGEIASTEILPLGAASYAVNRIIPKIVGEIKTFGRKELEIDTLVPENVLSGAKRFPESGAGLSAKQRAKLHADQATAGSYQLPSGAPKGFHQEPEGLLGYHATTSSNIKVLNQPFHLSTKGISVNFLRVMKSPNAYGSSLFESVGQPQVLAVRPLRYEANVGTEVTRTPKTIYKWNKPVKPNVAYTPGTKLEAQAVIDSGELSIIGKRFYFKFKGIKIPLDEAVTVTDLSKATMKLKGGKLKSTKGLKQEISSYNYNPSRVHPGQVLTAASRSLSKSKSRVKSSKSIASSSSAIPFISSSLIGSSRKSSSRVSSSISSSRPSSRTSSSISSSSVSSLLSSSYSGGSSPSLSSSGSGSSFSSTYKPPKPKKLILPFPKFKQPSAPGKTERLLSITSNSRYTPSLVGYEKKSKRKKGALTGLEVRGL